MGREVAKSRKSSVHKNMGTWEHTQYTNIPTYRRTQPLLWGGVIYLSTQSLLLDSSLFYSNSQNIKELIC